MTNATEDEQEAPTVRSTTKDGKVIRIKLSRAFQSDAEKKQWTDIERYDLDGAVTPRRVEVTGEDEVTLHFKDEVRSRRFTIAPIDAE